MSSPRSRWALIGPGLLVAATGVGAGDLATGAFTGSRLGVAVLWAAVVGALLKFVLNEGLARWQIATGETLLEGALLRLGRLVRLGFGIYLLLWSWFVGTALISATGATSHALMPIFADASHGKVVFGIVFSLVGAVLVEVGGYALFEKLMRVCIGIMFVVVLVTAGCLVSDWGAVASGLVVPTIPDADGQGLGWTVALMGGVGGTLTVLCYGYWIREAGRDGPGSLTACRIDLAVGYTVTALFGVAMVIIGSAVEIDGRGASLLVTLGDKLEAELGPAVRWAFLAGAWGAVFSSLLGVWQSVPYVFADFWRLRSGTHPGTPIDTRGAPYRVYLWSLAVVPMVGLGWSFREVQKAYAVFGAAFLPLLALALLVLNGRRSWVGEGHRNRWPSVLALGVALLFFAVTGVRSLLG